jgi:hypothetical protein
MAIAATSACSPAAWTDSVRVMPATVRAIATAIATSIRGSGVRSWSLAASLVIALVFLPETTDRTMEAMP